MVEEKAKVEYEIVRVIDSFRPTLTGERAPTKIVTYKTPTNEFRSIMLDAEAFDEDVVKKAIVVNEKSVSGLVGKKITV